MEVLQNFSSIICGMFSIQYLQVLDNSPNSKFHYNRAFVWDLIPKFIMKCLVLSLRGVSHSARAQTQLLMQRELFPSPFTSNLSQENQEQPQANSHLPTHLWVGFSITCDISFPHVSGGKLHVCVESKQPIIHILLLVPLDKFSLLEEGFWLW